MKLELFKPRQETWRDQHLAGVDAPLLCLVARYEAESNLRMAATVQMLRRNAHKELNKVYGCPA